jgi:glucokinase
MTGATVLALDIGGTKLAGALVNAGDGQVGPILMAPTPPGTGEQVWAGVAELARQVLDRAAETEGTVGAVGAVSAACPGPMDPGEGTVSPVNICGWRDFPLRPRLAELAGVPATVANDAICAALGEYRWGAGRGSRSMLGMVVSTGVGGGLILGGRVYMGPTGNAGHIGHAVADPDGEPCPCGGRGCVETFASGPSLVRRARAAGWRAPSDATAADLSRDAASGNKHALGAFNDAGRALAAAIVSAAALVDLDRVVVAGGVAAAGDLILRPTLGHCAAYAGLAFIRRLRICAGSLTQPVAGLLGAAAMAAET